MDLQQIQAYRVPERYQILFRETTSTRTVAEKPVGGVMAQTVSGDSEQDVAETFRMAGYAVVRVSFVRFVPDGLPGDGLTMKEWMEHFGFSRRTASREVLKFDRIGTGKRTRILLSGIERFVQARTLKAA